MGKENLKMYQTEHRAPLKYSVVWEAGVPGNGSSGAELRAPSLLGSTAASSAPSSVGGGRVLGSVCSPAGRAERDGVRAG